MGNPLILYSVNTILAYEVNTTYYNDTHFVWCAPYFDCRKTPRNYKNNPPTSNPCEFYKLLLRSVRAEDKHCEYIRKNRIGVEKGAKSKRLQGVIDDAQEKEIISLANVDIFSMFKPLLYIIPFETVKDVCERVPLAEKAHPLSQEFIIKELKGNMFDIIELGNE